MYIVIVSFILLTCVLLALVVLVQNSKGGGLAANFSSQNQIMGVRKTADFLEKSNSKRFFSIIINFYINNSFRKITVIIKKIIFSSNVNR